MTAFDQYAAGYTAGMEHPLKRFAGGSAEAFLAVKSDWLVRDLARRRLASTGDSSSTALRVLDYGCGAGTFLNLLDQSDLDCELHGWDPSAAMLGEAARRYPGGFEFWDQSLLGKQTDGFHVVIVCCVLHHVAAEDRGALFREVHRVLLPGGRLYVFEHNPRNPVTRFVVRGTAIDRRATLVSAAEVDDGLRRTGWCNVETNYLMFFPPRWTWCRRWEEWLRRCPWGGQYLVTATKR